LFFPYFEDRFMMNRLDDEADVLACMAYVDLNPINAGIAPRITGIVFVESRKAPWYADSA
jgi:hypothetical protein